MKIPNSTRMKTFYNYSDEYFEPKLHDDRYQNLCSVWLTLFYRKRSGLCSGSSWGWCLLDDSTANLPYICEIGKEDLYKIISYERDYGEKWIYSLTGFYDIMYRLSFTGVRFVDLDQRECKEVDNTVYSVHSS